MLVVEDDLDWALALATLIRHLGHEVEMAQDGQQALLIAGAFDPGVALIDLGLPGTDGFEVARRLRELWKGRPLKLIAVTGYNDEATRLKSSEAGFDRHVVKPLDPDQLERLLA